MVSLANRPFVVAKADDAGFAAALQRLASDGALRAEIGDANRSLAIAHNDEVTMLARYRQLYGNAMKRADFARQS
jgi:L-malate glycosyltransferase